MIVSVDFEGVCIADGSLEPVGDILCRLKEAAMQGFKLIAVTQSREVARWFKDNDLPLYAISDTHLSGCDLYIKKAIPTNDKKRGFVRCWCQNSRA